SYAVGWTLRCHVDTGHRRCSSGYSSGLLKERASRSGVMRHGKAPGRGVERNRHSVSLFSWDGFTVPSGSSGY
ncbi:MAG: hypothetical protein MK103_06170, partial [Planctomycetes bacterium]|nr:hypothetical protein [Planctomycetota bacterium]